MRILNFGSLNIDYFYYLDHFVKPGETEASAKRTVGCGGKGLNQSVSLAKAGAEVYHAGACGKMDGTILLNALKEAGVNCDHIYMLDEIGSGNAFIQVNKEGENCIVLYGGANQAIDQTMIEDVLDDFEAGDWLLLQNEIAGNRKIMEAAHAKGMKIILNPSPMNEQVLSLPLEYVDLFLVNEEEGKVLAEGRDDVLNVLEKRYPKAMIVMTLGSKGAVCVWEGKHYAQKAFPVEVVDTTGAGDAFTGYFLYARMKKMAIPEALEIASAAAAVAVTRNGAGNVVPGWEETCRWLEGKR